MIGSGATAVTLVPELAKTAAQVTMLQRTPTYIITAPQKDQVAQFFQKVLPSKIAYKLARWKNILTSIALYNVSQKWPNFMRTIIQKGIKKELGEKYEKKHFDPPYNPWDQRLCLVPDSDLFKSINDGKATIVTDQIIKFTPKGILLQSNEHLDADIIVTATGLNMLLFGGLILEIDGKKVDLSQTYCYRGMMLSDIPNFFITIGYTNASWTLKCNLTNEYVCRLLNYMRKNDYKVCTPKIKDEERTEQPLLHLSSGYIERSMNVLPKQGSRAPWSVNQNYIKDLFSMRYSSLSDPSLEYHR